MVALAKVALGSRARVRIETWYACWLLQLAARCTRLTGRVRIETGRWKTTALTLKHNRRREHVWKDPMLHSYRRHGNVQKRRRSSG